MGWGLGYWVTSVVYLLAELGPTQVGFGAGIRDGLGVYPRAARLFGRGLHDRGRQLFRGTVAAVPRAPRPGSE